MAPIVPQSRPVVQKQINSLSLLGLLYSAYQCPLWAISTIRLGQPNLTSNLPLQTSVAATESHLSKVGFDGSCLPEELLNFWVKWRNKGKWSGHWKKNLVMDILSWMISCPKWQKELLLKILTLNFFSMLSPHDIILLFKSRVIP